MMGCFKKLFGFQRLYTIMPRLSSGEFRVSIFGLTSRVFLCCAHQALCAFCFSIGVVVVVVVATEDGVVCMIRELL
jgi:hypothetical protein